MIVMRRRLKQAAPSGKSILQNSHLEFRQIPFGRLTRIALSAYAGLTVPAGWDRGFIRTAPAFT
jgi:hypothetical protein